MFRWAEQEMSRRATRAWEYSELLEECQSIFFDQRRLILQAPTVAKMHAALAAGTLGESLRVCCAELCDLCHRCCHTVQYTLSVTPATGAAAHTLINTLCIRPLCLLMLFIVTPSFVRGSLPLVLFHLFSDHGTVRRGRVACTCYSRELSMAVRSIGVGAQQTPVASGTLGVRLLWVGRSALVFALLCRAQNGL